MLNERASFRLHHPVSEFGVLAEQGAGNPDFRLAQRVIDAYQAGPGAVSAGPVWDPLLTGKQNDFIRWLAIGDVAAVARELAALGRSEAAQGFFGGANQHRKSENDPDFANLLAAWTYDKLLSLAEAIGAVRLELPETGPWRKNILIPPSELVERIEGRLGIELAPPSHIGGFLGLSVGRYVIQMRVIEAVYAAWRLKSLLDRYGYQSVCEIGAGAGLSAYYSVLMGVKEYVIIDLPSMNAFQGYMLAGSDIGRHVALHGEGYSENTKIRILPTCAFSELKVGSIDILFNQDSFPEIEYCSAVEYIEGSARINIPVFLSINQEAHLPTDDGYQRSVSELVEVTGVYTSRNRHRHWLRQGYAEELYEIIR